MLYIQTDKREKAVPCKLSNNHNLCINFIGDICTKTPLNIGEGGNILLLMFFWFFKGTFEKLRNTKGCGDQVK